MPIYTYGCDKCERVTDAYRPMAEREQGPECCGQPMKQRIVPPMIAPILGGGSMPGYKCPVTDTFVTSRKQRREIMAEHNLIEKG